MVLTGGAGGGKRGVDGGDAGVKVPHFALVEAFYWLESNAHNTQNANTSYD